MIADKLFFLDETYGLSLHNFTKEEIDDVFKQILAIKNRMEEENRAELPGEDSDEDDED